MVDKSGQKLLQDIERLTHKVQLIAEELESLQKIVLGTIPKKEVPTHDISLLICRIGTEQAALMLDFVECVVNAAKLSPYPESPEWIPGYLNYHGTVVPIIDIRTRMTGEVRTIQISDYIVLCTQYDRLFGLLVQDVVESCVIETLELNENEQQISQARYFIGIINNLGKPIPLLSIEKLIKTSQIPEIKSDG